MEQNSLMMFDHPVWRALQEHFLKNFPEYITFIAALSIAVIVTWPELIPGRKELTHDFWQDIWTWARNAFQTAVPAARGHQAPPPVVVPPATPAVVTTEVTDKAATQQVTVIPPAVEPSEPPKEP